MLHASGAPVTQNKRPNKIFIDGKMYETFITTLTGAELKEMAGVSVDSDLLLINQGPHDIMIGNDEIVDLSRTGVEHFATRV